MAPLPVLAVTGLGVALAGCSAVAARPSPARSCTGDERLAIASRIYRQAAGGRVAAGAAARIARSPSLAAAVARDDPAATRAALAPLLRGQVKRIVVTQHGRRLVSLGRAASLAPVQGTIGAGPARFTLSTMTDHGFAALVHELTGARVAIGPAGTGALDATAFPSGPLKIKLGGSAPCGASSAIVTAAHRLLRAERTSPRTRQVLRTVARDPRFVHAVVNHDPVALRAQIVRFFREPSLHVVRIRATDARGRLVNDVGGPYVLAPASMAVRSHGRRVGTVTLSIQDDAGYIKLLHRFTGAAVALRTPAGPVPGSEPLSGPIFSFTASAFPSGPLQISLAQA